MAYVSEPGLVPPRMAADCAPDAWRWWSRNHVTLSAFSMKDGARSKRFKGIESWYGVYSKYRQFKNRIRFRISTLLICFTWLLFLKELNLDKTFPLKLDFSELDRGSPRSFSQLPICLRNEIKAKVLVRSKLPHLGMTKMSFFERKGGDMIFGLKYRPLLSTLVL